MRILWTHELVAFGWTTTIFAVLLTIGRFIIHWRNRKRLAWDDVLNGVAAVFLLAFTGTWQAFAPLDYDYQLYTMGLLDKEPVMTLTDVDRITKYNAANTIIFWCTIYSVKASFLALYWYIFEVSKGFRWAWIGATVYITLSFLISVLFYFWNCETPKYFVNLDGCALAGREILVKMWITWCVLDGLGDIILMMLPITMLRKMFLRPAQKLQLTVVFGLVVINIILGVLRTVYTALRDLHKFPDQNTLWVFLQVTTAVIVCCLPCYGSLLTRKKKSPQSTPLFQSAESGSYGKSGYSRQTASSDNSSAKEKDAVSY